MFARLCNVMIALSLAIIAGIAVTWYLDERPTSNPSDAGVRHWLGTKTITSQFRVPDGQDHYLIRFLSFENGQPVKSDIGFISGDAAQLPNRVIDLAVIWGELNGKCRVATVQSFTRMTSESEFWSKVGAGVSSAGRAGSLGRYDDNFVAGFAVSAENQRGGSTFQLMNLERAIAFHKHVGAVAIQCFSSAEERDSQIK